jgi:hypothetical protein
MRLRHFPSLALIAALAACDSGDPVAPQVDIDAALTEIATGAVSFGSFGMGSTVPMPAANSASCAFDAPSGYFKCPPVTTNGITFARQFQLRDASGSPLSTRDPLLVASIRSVTDVDGSIAASAELPIAIQIQRHDDATLSGLQSTNRVLDGVATQAVTVSSDQATITVNDTTTTTQLKLPSTPQQKYPLGGTIVSSGAIYDADAVPEKYRIEITFDGTSIVTVKTTFGGETWTCRLNLANADSEPVCT